MYPHKLQWTLAGTFILWVASSVYCGPAAAQAHYEFQILHSFPLNSPLDGAGPEGQLVLDSDGNLYGATRGGGTYLGGTLYELSPGANGQWTETILYSFCSLPQCADGKYPNGVVMDDAGNLYGTTNIGGVTSQCVVDGGCGVAFELSPGANGQWTESTLWTFCSLPNCADGGGPLFPPTLGLASVLYGTAGNTAFELTPGTPWIFNILYTFCSQPNCADGTEPGGSLTLDEKGNLYGASGGAPSRCSLVGCGQVFSLHPQANGQWNETVLYIFPGGDGGNGPSEVTLHDHHIFGPTGAGGSPDCFGGCGTVFELSRGFAQTGLSEQVLHDFAGNGAQGVAPIGGIIFDPAGNLFGVTPDGGASMCGCGVVYGMKPRSDGKWDFGVLHTFVGTDGISPDVRLNHRQRRQSLRHHRRRRSRRSWRGLRTLAHDASLEITAPRVTAAARTVGFSRCQVIERA